MAEERALMIPGDSMALTFEDTMRLGTVLVKSGYFRDMRDASQAVVKILMGREFGIPPMTAVRGIHIIEGKPELSAGLMGGLLQKAGYSWVQVQLDDAACVLEFYHNGKSLGRVSFGLDDAKDAGLASKANYKGYAEDMFFARCVSRGARRFAPGVLMGNVYVEGEITVSNGGDSATTPTVTAEGEIVDGEGPAQRELGFLDDDTNRVKVLAYLEKNGVSHDDAVSAVSDWRTREASRSVTVTWCKGLIQDRQSPAGAPDMTTSPASAGGDSGTPDTIPSSSKPAAAVDPTPPAQDAPAELPVDAEWADEIRGMFIDAGIPVAIRTPAMRQWADAGSTQTEAVALFRKIAKEYRRDPDATLDVWNRQAGTSSPQPQPAPEPQSEPF